MKKTLLSLSIALLPLSTFAQNVIVPNRFAFQKEDNQYQLNILTKFLLEKQGFTAYMENEVPVELSQNPCNALRAEVKNQSNIMTSKVQLLLTDCTNKTVFTSQIGKSREKEFKKSYQEAVRNVFVGTDLANFKAQYQAPTIVKTISAPSSVSSTPTIAFLYAQKTEEGYDLLDTQTQELRFKIRPTQAPEVFSAFDVIQKQSGILEKDGSTFYKFTFYEQKDETTITLSVQIKF
nr:hypothetical protein [uncultured Capnocytophaga sp.]